MLLALIPAAGKSARMGRPKLLLPVGGRPVLAWVVEAFHRAGVDHVLVVVPPDATELAAVAATAGASVLPLSRQTPDMRATIEEGLGWLEHHLRPGAADLWLLCPADHPTLRSEVTRLLLGAAGGDPDHSIFLPVCGGRRGHPALLRWHHVARIREQPRDQGLNVYLRQCRGETREVPVEDEGVLLDLDTPEDYERLCRRWPG